MKWRSGPARPGPFRKRQMSASVEDFPAFCVVEAVDGADEVACDASYAFKAYILAYERACGSVREGGGGVGHDADFLLAMRFLPWS